MHATTTVFLEKDKAWEQSQSWHLLCGLFPVVVAVDRKGCFAFIYSVANLPHKIRAQKLES
jgi:hypothetical protein